MIKLRIVFLTTAVLLLPLASALAAIKPCGELKKEITAKLVAHKVNAYTLTITDTDQAENVQGKVVGSCENSSKKIVYIRRVDWLKDTPSSPQKKAASPAAAAQERTLDEVSKKKAEDAQVEAISTQVIAEGKGIKRCKDLQAEIEAKLIAHKVKAYELHVVSKDAAAPGKVVGTCENSSKKIMYLRK